MPTLRGKYAWDFCVYDELRSKRIKVKDNMTIKGIRKILQIDTPDMHSTGAHDFHFEMTPTLGIVAKILSEPNAVAGPTASSRDTAKEVLSHE